MTVWLKETTEHSLPCTHIHTVHEYGIALGDAKASHDSMGYKCLIFKYNNMNA